MFRRYPSLTNHYNVNLNNLNLEMPVTVTEKIDGSNISLCVESGNIPMWASRSHIVGNTWNGIGSLLSSEHLKNVQDFCNATGYRLNIYGEIFSSKILKRLPYGDTKLVFYDMALNGYSVPQNDFYNITRNLSLYEYVAPHTVSTLGVALELDVERLYSQYTDAEAIAEGIVIKALHSRAINHKIYAIKKKSAAFEEKTRLKTKATSDIALLFDRFRPYLNENRVLSVISKRQTSTMHDVGTIIRDIIEDALEDFKIDSESSGGGIGKEAERKLYRSSGKVIAPLVIKNIKL
jgi:hypothetical protein